MKRRNGFSLTELILVISILAIVAIILILSDFGPRGEYSPRVYCAIQLRGLGNATGMYLNDFDDKFPIVWSDKVVKAGFGTGWYNAKGENKYNRWVDPEWKDWDKQPTVGGVCIYWSSMKMCRQRLSSAPVPQTMRKVI